MEPKPLYVAHCGDGPAAEAVPDGDGRWRVCCAGCGKALVIDEEEVGVEAGADALDMAEVDLVRVEPEDPIGEPSPAWRLRILLNEAHALGDVTRGIATLCESWYRELVEAEDDTTHRVTDLFVAGDLVYVTLETEEGGCRFDARGVLVSEPTAVLVWTLVWGPGTRFPDEVVGRLAERFPGPHPAAMEDVGPFRPFLAWWSPSLWRIGHRAAITPEIDPADVADAVAATRRLARRVASLAADPAAMAPSPGGKPSA